MTALENYAKKNQYDRFSKFTSLQEFNNHFEHAMALHKDKFTKSEYIALNKLRKFAADYFGVAWCRIQKAVAGTHKDSMFGVSRSSFERMLRKAKELNLVTVINQQRRNKWQKHNVYVFNRAEELTVETDGIVSKSHTIDVPKDEKIEAPITKNLSLTNKTKNKINTYATRPATQEGLNQVSGNQKPSLRERMAALLGRKHKLNVLNEFASIAYGMIHKLCTAEPRLSKEHAEEIAFSEFTNAVNSKSAKNPFAVFSARMKNVLSLLSGRETHINPIEIALRQGKKISTIPQWIIDQEENPIRAAELQMAKKAQERLSLIERSAEKLPDWFVADHLSESNHQYVDTDNIRPEQIETETREPDADEAYFATQKAEFLKRLANL